MSLETIISPALRNAKNPRHVAALNLIVSEFCPHACQTAFRFLKILGDTGICRKQIAAE